MSVSFSHQFTQSVFSENILHPSGSQEQPLSKGQITRLIEAIVLPSARHYLKAAEVDLRAQGYLCKDRDYAWPWQVPQ